MVRGKTAAKKREKVLSITEVQNIKEERQDLQSTLSEAESAGIGTQAEQIDKGVIKSQINRLDKFIDKAKPGRLKNAQKDVLVQR